MTKGGSGKSVPANVCSFQICFLIKLESNKSKKTLESEWDDAPLR